jgi:hypothetical protein
MDINPLQDRPSEVDFDAMVTRVHATIRRTVRAESRPWWRRLSRLTTVAVAVVATGAVAGGAYAATQLFTPSPPPAVLTGDNVIKLDKPAPEDKWLNVQMVYTCKPGEHFTLRDGERVIFDQRCRSESRSHDESTADPKSAASPDSSVVSGRADRGIALSIPIEEVNGRQLVLDSTLSRDYRIEAVFSPTAEMKHLVLPGRRADGQTDWATPDYTVNSFGLTVGQLNINTPEGQGPDLIPITFKGREAYILGEDWSKPWPMNPEQAVKDQERQRREGLLDDKGNIYSKVYAADGKTVLGKIHVGTTSSQ